MVGEEGGQAALHDGAGEQGAHGMASANDLGTAQLLPQLLAGAEADALDDDVVVGDVVGKVLVFLEAQLEAERADLVNLHGAPIEERLAQLVPQGFEHGHHVHLVDAGGIAYALGHLFGGHWGGGYYAHTHQGILLGGFALEVVPRVQLVGNGATLLCCFGLSHRSSFL